jgi:hypothetical protein
VGTGKSGKYALMGTVPPRGPPTHARAASASTEARLVHHPALAGGLTAMAVLLVRAARSSLEAGALRQYIAKSCKEERQQRDRRRPSRLALRSRHERQSRLHPGANAIGEAP